MTLELLTIADALAARYAPAVITPPAGLTNIKKSTARPENNAPPDPFVFVFLDDGELVYLTRRAGEHRFLVRFYHSPKAGDTAEAHFVLLSWLGVLLDATHAQSKLGLAPIVDKALPTGYRTVVLTYGGTEYNGLELSVTVWTTDSVDLVP